MNASFEMYVDFDVLIIELLRKSEIITFDAIILYNIKVNTISFSMCNMIGRSGLHVPGL